MTYGKDAAARLLTEYQIVALAALNGDVAALTQLVETAAQTSYTAGFGAAMMPTAPGLPL